MFDSIELNIFENYVGPIAKGAFRVTHEAHNVLFYSSLLFDEQRTNDTSCA